MWEQFIASCQSKGTTATATLTRFIELYLDGSLDDLDAIGAITGKLTFPPELKFVLLRLATTIYIVVQQSLGGDRTLVLKQKTCE
jgi:hypothetical protein